MNSLFIDSQALFGVRELTASINLLPFVPGAIGRLNLFRPSRLTVPFTMIERRAGRLALVSSQPRGGVPDINVDAPPAAVPFAIPHFPIRDALHADQIMGVRAFGTDNQLETIADARDEKLASMSLKLDVTQEHLRFGAVRGIVVTSVDRKTGEPLQTVDLFNSFGIAPPAPLNWPILQPPGGWTEAMAWRGTITDLCQSVVMQMGRILGGSAPTGIYCLCGAKFWTSLVGAPELRQTFLATAQAASLRAIDFRQVISYNGIQFELYNAYVGNFQFLADDEAAFFPMGVPDLFVEAYAPADYVETTNTLALPRYAKAELMEFDKGWKMESQMNVLPLCTIPEVLLTAKATPSTP